MKLSDRCSNSHCSSYFLNLNPRLLECCWCQQSATIRFHLVGSRLRSEPGLLAQLVSTPPSAAFTLFLRPNGSFLVLLLVF